MEKRPTIFGRGPDFKITDQIRPGCEWVFTGEGEATEKIDGTNVRLTIRSGQLERIEKRRNPSKLQKRGGIVDGWYVDADEQGKEDKWIVEAARNTDVAGWPDGEHSCEAIGPKIQSNTLGLDRHECVPFNMAIPRFEGVPRSYAGFKAFPETVDSKYAPGHLAEGIVFRHPDGRRAKIKRKDFASYESVQRGRDLKVIPEKHVSRRRTRRAGRCGVAARSK